MSEARSTLRSVGRSHPGKVRAHNEDAFLERPDLGLWVVADGMGGLARGEVASCRVVEALAGVPAPASAPAFVQAVRAALDAANEDLRRGAEAGTMMGSTVAGLLVYGAHVAAFWAGDSRVYRLRDGELDRLTRDHSLVQDMVDAGIITPREAENHPRGNVITRAVGVGERLELDFTQAKLMAGDTFLLCSDGLTRDVADLELEAAIGGAALDTVCDGLIERALSRGARDNVTAVLVRCDSL